MFDLNIYAHVFVRLSIVLLIGWLALRWMAKRNPRWSVAITRCMITACIGLPVIHFWLPATSVALSLPL